MTEIYTIRFTDFEHYDPSLDAEMVKLMATTPIGTYSCDVRNEPGAKMREQREAFKEYVLNSIAMKNPPHEIEMG